MEKPNCYQCPHRGSIPGNAHSRCNHPALSALSETGSVAELASFFDGPPLRIHVDLDGKKIPLTVFNEHGIRNGWAAWPFNFDPVWLDFCLLWLADQDAKKEAATE